MRRNLTRLKQDRNKKINSQNTLIKNKGFGSVDAWPYNYKNKWKQGWCTVNVVVKRMCSGTAKLHRSAVSTNLFALSYSASWRNKNTRIWLAHVTQLRAPIRTWHDILLANQKQAAIIRQSVTQPCVLFIHFQKLIRYQERCTSCSWFVLSFTVLCLGLSLISYSDTLNRLDFHYCLNMIKSFFIPTIK